LPQRAQTVFEPRKRPVQARSTATVEAILEAAIQVLLSVGKDRLTTTRVAMRAGVSVGTLYQYFPNKSALLKAVLRGHLDEVTSAVERACAEQKGNTLARMATGVVAAFLAAKMQHVSTSVALYSVSSDVDGASVSKKIAIRTNRALVALLESAREPLTKDPRLIASMMQGTMAGVSRRLLESDAPEKQLESVQQELIVLVSAYLETCAARKSSRVKRRVA
jgi:AcrR family transcriptional regulator